MKLTLRARLTLVYGAAFALAGTVLVTLMYFQLSAALDRQPLDTVSAAAQVIEASSLQPALPTTGATTPSASTLPIEQVRAEVVRQNTNARDNTLRLMLLWSFAALGGVGIVAVGIGWLMATRLLAPLHSITATARRVAEHSLHERIALDGPTDEIKDLADTFDEMLERLDRSFDGQRRFVANASHELRTPLTINRTVIEVALDEPEAPESTRQLGRTLLAVNAQHERLIDGLLTLATTEQMPPDRDDINLAEIVTHTVRQATPGATVDLRVVAESAPLAGDPVLLERLAQNLVDNAIRHNIPVGGFVTVSSQRLPDGSAELTVSNSGPIVPSYEVERLFEPFRRLAPNGTLADRKGSYTTRGAGLGLSIVRSVAIAHGGTVTAEARPDGGLTVRVQLPGNAS
ncbi:sensor histidine kinase [Micromonospora sp. NBC_01412]|uniref:sensor histidine kinase n=1 Tax=Micromonospora sp. NBC_01412 TaxID=2903590 RepID=UPI0032485034